MAIKAVGFDIGDVLERVGPPDRLTQRWRERLGMSPEAYDAALARVDPESTAGTGGFTEAQITAGFAAELGLSAELAAQFMADMWDWYCGELDGELVAYAASLRPRLRTGILSNSVEGARREEQSRYGFEQLVDVIVYSHEAGVAKPDPRAFERLCAALAVEPGELVFVDDLPGHIDAACALGIRGVLHVSTPETIAAVEALTNAASV